MSQAKTPIWDQCDTLHLRGALVAINSLLDRLPSTSRLNKAGRRACDKACDARNALRALLEEHDVGRLTLAEFGGWEPLRVAQAPAEAGTTPPQDGKAGGVMKAVEILSVAEMCDEIREAPAYDAGVGITHEQLVNAYERLRLVAQELGEWIEGTEGDRYEDANASAEWAEARRAIHQMEKGGRES